MISAIHAMGSGEFLSLVRFGFSVIHVLPLVPVCVSDVGVELLANHKLGSSQCFIRHSSGPTCSTSLPKGRQRYPLHQLSQLW